MKFHIKTFGCKVNQYETQLLREQLESLGATPSENMEDADACVINSCTVTHTADADCRQQIRRILKHNPDARIVVTGCLAASAAGTELKKIHAGVEICPEKEAIPVLLAGNGKKPRTSISYFQDHSRAFVKIQDGCDACCSYCVVPSVRPVLRSRPRKEILGEIGALTAGGYGKIVLCGIRLGKYSDPESGCGLAGLLDELLRLDDRAEFELSSLEINEINDELISVMAGSPRVSRHLHIPLQSGDNSILKRMKRPYTSEKYSERLARIRAGLPGARVTTDIIVGFPGETRENFENTARFVKENGFGGVHVFRYSARPGTAAAKTAGQCPLKTSPDEIKSRANRIRELAR